MKQYCYTLARFAHVLLYIHGLNDVSELSEEGRGVDLKMGSFLRWEVRECDENKVGKRMVLGTVKGSGKRRKI
jgi:hypothetical protein